MLLEIFIITAGALYAATKCVGSGYRKASIDEYMRIKRFNLKRQDELRSMMFSTSAKERIMFRKMCGYSPNLSDHYDTARALKIAMEKEGWTYYDCLEVSKDPDYRKAAGIKSDLFNPEMDKRIIPAKPIDKSKNKRGGN